MRIISIRTLHGPNLFAHRPVIIMRLDLEDLTGKETKDIPGFNERLLALLPGLTDHRCSRRRAGGFVERLREGTFFSHTVEHVALELSELAGMPAYFGKAIATEKRGIFDIVTEFDSEQGMHSLLHLACSVIDSLVAGKEISLEDPIRQAQAVAAANEMGPSTRALVDAAERRGFPWRQLGEGSSIIDIGYGSRRRRIQAAMSDETGVIGVDVAGDKQLTKRLLADAMIPVPAGKVTRTIGEALAALEAIGSPVAVKPADGNQANGVTLNVCSPAAMADAFAHAATFSSQVLVEEMIEGNDYRVLVVGGKAIAAAQRCPAQVTGDGVRTVKELIDQMNSDPDRGQGHAKPLTFVEITEVVLRNLEAAGLTLEDIPESGKKVLLQQAANLSTGGTASDVTDLMHPEVARTCERAARIIGIDICGIDLVLRDITRPMGKNNGCILEVNASPGLRMHLYPTHGKGRAVGEAIMETLYPQETSARIPIISTTGTNGKTTVTRMIGHILSKAGWNVGMTTTEGLSIRGEMVARGDLTGFQSARTVLCDPAVDIAVLETARGGIVRSGLGYDWSDVGIITTIQPDHVGQDGIRSVQDILYIKSLIAERVREGGTLILNLDDELVASVADLPRVREPRKNIVYFSLKRRREEVQQHAGGSGTGYYLEDGWIMEVKGLQQQPFMHVSMIPATLEGLAVFNIANAMAAIAATRACGVSPKEITASLMQFSTERSNPGRVNLFRVQKGYVLLDYGHNAEAIGAIARMAAAAECARVTGIVGIPGDRADWVIQEAATVAAHGFQRLIIREDIDLRGRQSGEVTRLLHDAVRNAVPGRECFVIPDTRSALERALADMVDDELIVIFYEEFEPLLELLRLYDAVPVQSMVTRRHAKVKTAI